VQQSRDLPCRAAHGTGRCRHEHVLAGLQPGDAGEADVRGQPGSAEDTEESAERNAVHRGDHPNVGFSEHGVRAPAVPVEDDGSHRERGRPRLDHPPQRAAFEPGSLFPSAEVHQLPHVRVDGQVGLLTSAYATVMGGVAAVASGVAVPISEAALGGWYTALGCWIVLALVAIVLWLPQLRTPAAVSTTVRGGHRLPWGSGLAWAVTAFMGLQSLGFYVIVTWLPGVVQDTGIRPAAAGWLLFVFQIVAVLTSLAAPAMLRWACDQRAVATVNSLIMLAGYIGLLTAPEWALVWTIILGLGGGACLVLALAFLGLRAQDAAGAGALAAMAQSVGYLLAAVGPVLFGLLHTASSGWHVPLILMCVAAVGQTIVAMVAGRGTVRSAGNQRKLRVCRRTD
jgi:hypothetical protein